MSGKSDTLLKGAGIGIAIIAVVLFLSKKIDAAWLFLLLILSTVLMVVLPAIDKVGTVFENAARLNFQTAETLNTVSRAQLAMSAGQEKKLKIRTILSVIGATATLIPLCVKLIGIYLASH